MSLVDILIPLHSPHKKVIISILEAIKDPPAGIVPTRKLLLLPYLLENKKLTSEDQYDKNIKHLKEAGHITVSDRGPIGLTDTGLELLKNYKKLWLLKPSILLKPVMLALISIKKFFVGSDSNS